MTPLTPIERLCLPQKTYMALVRNGVDHVEQLAAMSRDEIRRLRRVGERAMRDIDSVLRSLA